MHDAYNLKILEGYGMHEAYNSKSLKDIKYLKQRILEVTKILIWFKAIWVHMVQLS